MKDTTIVTIALSAVITPLVTIALVVVIALMNILSPPDLPRCQEDQVLVGYGQFEDGRWSGYQCGPALDDFGG